MKFSKSGISHWYFLDEEEISAQTGIKGHQVRKTLYELTPDGILTMRKNFCWNGSSFVQDTPKCMRASAFHDALCRMIAEGLLPASCQGKADKLYFTLCRDDGMSWLQARIRLAGLRVYGIVSNIG